MAQSITCDLCGQNVAAMLQTDLGTGETLGICGACTFPFFLGATLGIAAEMPGDVKAAYAADVHKLAGTFPPLADDTAEPVGRGNEPGTGKPAPRRRTVAKAAEDTGEVGPARVTPSQTARAKANEYAASQGMPAPYPGETAGTS